MPKLHGRIWYADGSVVDFCSREEWESAPDGSRDLPGILTVCQPTLSHRAQGGDFYWMDEGGFVNSCNTPESIKKRERRLGVSIHVKEGELVGHDAFKALDGVVVDWFRKNGEDCGCV